MAVTGPTSAGHSRTMADESVVGAGARASAAAVVRAADPVDFDALYAQHFQLVWRSLRRLGVAESSLDDALQDVFLAVHRRLGDFEARSSVKTWLFGFILRVARDHRRRGARTEGALEPLPPSLADARPDPHEQLERAEALHLLDEALGELDEERRAAFVMGEIEQMSAPEVAAVLGLKVNTVYSRIRLARRDLEQAIARRTGGSR